MSEIASDIPGILIFYGQSLRYFKINRFCLRKGRAGRCWSPAGNYEKRLYEMNES